MLKKITRHFLLAIGDKSLALEIERVFSEEYKRLDCKVADSTEDLQILLKQSPPPSMVIIDSDLFGNNWLQQTSHVRKSNKTLTILVAAQKLTPNLRDELTTLSPPAEFISYDELSAQRIVGLVDSAYFYQDQEAANHKYLDASRQATKLIDKQLNRSHEREAVQLIFHDLVNLGKLRITEFEFRMGHAALALLGFTENRFLESVIRDLAENEELIEILEAPNKGPDVTSSISPTLIGGVELAQIIFTLYKGEKEITAAAIRATCSSYARRVLINLKPELLDQIRRSLQGASGGTYQAGPSQSSR